MAEKQNVYAITRTKAAEVLLDEIDFNREICVDDSDNVSERYETALKMGAEALLKLEKQEMMAQKDSQYKGKSIVLKNFGDQDTAISIDIFGRVTINGEKFSCDDIQIIAYLALKQRSAYFEEGSKLNE